MSVPTDQNPGPWRWARLGGLVGILVLLVVAWSNWVPKPVPGLESHGMLPISDEGARLDFAPDGRALLVSGKAGSLALYDLKTRARIVAIQDPTLGANARPSYLISAFSPRGEWIASGDALRNGDVRVNDADLGFEVAKLAGTSRPLALRVAPDGQFLTTVSGASKTVVVKRWNPKTWAELPDPIPPLPSGGLMPELADDAVTLALADPDGSTVTVWDATTGQKRADLRPFGRFGEPVPALRALAFASGGRTLATGDRFGTIRLWDLPSGALRATLPGPRGEAEVFALRFTPDGRTLVAHESRVHNDPTPLGYAMQRMVDPRNADAPGPSSLTVWDVASGRKRFQAPGAPALGSFHIAIAPDGRTLATIDHAGVKFWDIDPSEGP